MNETVERFTFSGSIMSGPYLFQPIGLPVFHDIAFREGDSGEIWFACDASDSPVKAFSTGGSLTDYIEDEVIPAAHGLCFESDRYLWASNIHADEIYRIDLVPTGVAGGSGAALPGTAHLELSGESPFSEGVAVCGEGFGPSARVEVLDISGRVLLEDRFPGSYAWDARGYPSGVYVLRVYGEGESAALTVVKL